VKFNKKSKKIFFIFLVFTSAFLISVDFFGLSEYFINQIWDIPPNLSFENARVLSQRHRFWFAFIRYSLIGVVLLLWLFGVLKPWIQNNQDKVEDKITKFDQTVSLFVCTNQKIAYLFKIAVLSSFILLSLLLLPHLTPLFFGEESEAFSWSSSSSSSGSLLATGPTDWTHEEGLHSQPRVIQLLL